MDAPSLIITDTSFNDVGAVQSFDLDLAFGDNEQDFVATFAGHQLGGGELIYIDGTEYGGIVDSVESRTDSDLVEYKGRTWHGMLAYKVITPPPGQTHYKVNGDANDCIAAVLTKVDLDGIMSTPGTSSGIAINNYQFDRFIDAYTGLREMLAGAGAKLCMSREGGTTLLWAEAVDIIENQADSDLVEFGIGKNHRVLNHLVCAGEGEMLDRTRVDIYADAAGNVSTTQSLFGVDEIAAYYNYTGADLAELTTEGKKRLKESQSQGSIDIDVQGQGDWRVGDIIEGRDNRTGTTVRAPIVKKLVKVNAQTNYTLEVQYEAGAVMSSSGGLKNTTEAGGGISYTAGKGITITGNVIAADVEASDFANVAFTGEYDDLIDAPSLATVATTGDYDDLLDKPTIPTSTSELVNDSGFIGDALDADTDTPSDFATAETGYSLISGRFVQWGRIAALWLNVKTDASISANTNVTPVTLKTGYRPLMRSAGGDELNAIRLNANGTIDVRILSARSAGGTIYIAATYII